MVSATSVGEPVTAQPKPLAAAIAVLVAMEMETEDDIGAALPTHQTRLTCVSFAYLPAAQDNPFPAGESFESDRATRVKLVGRDADLSPESVFEAVGKARRRIDHHRARIDLAHEPHRVAVMLGDDGVGMLRAIASDVVDRSIERCNDTDGENRPEILGAPVLLR